MHQLTDHSFQWQTVPNSAGQFAKFCGVPIIKQTENILDY